VGLVGIALIVGGCGSTESRAEQQKQEAATRALARESAALEHERKELRAKHLPPGPSVDEIKKRLDAKEAAERGE
jgi:hypothetical protein